MKKILLQALFLINLALLFNFWYQGSGDFIREGTLAGILIALGRVTGLLAEFFILTQLVLIGRIHWVERVFGHAELASLHRVIGAYIAIFIISHPILLSIGWGMMTESSYFEQFVNFLAHWEDVLPAFFGLILFVVAIILSLAKIRSKMRYEKWHFTHLFMYIAIALAFGHQTQTGDMSGGKAYYYWMVLNLFVFGSMILYRFLRPVSLFIKHNFKVEKVVQESKDVWSVYIGGNKMDQFTFSAGQFAEISFLKKGMWAIHPFSFSAAPNGTNIRFTVKSLGDFTDRVKEIPVGTKVLIDGPLGTFTEKECITGKYLFIAGGVGITPIAGIIDSLHKKNLDKKVSLIYCVRTAAQIPFREDFEKLPITTSYVVSDEGSGAWGQNYLSGKIDGEKIEKLCPDFRERDVYFCGPPLMGDDIVNTLIKLGVPKKQIHYEKFAF